MEKIYTPTKEDFDFIQNRNLNVDKNFASQGYWRGVFVHFTRNKFAMTGVILVGRWKLYIVAMLILNILYGIIDPRIKLTAKDG